MNLNPAPFSRLASTIRSGLVSTIAQTFAGVKTFAGGLIASAGVTINAALTVAKPPVVNEPSVYLPAPVSSGGYGLAGAMLWSTTNSYLHHSTTALSLNAYAVPLKLTAAFSTVEVAGGNGTGASDVGVKVGVSTADASVNATAKIASFRTGIGGTEVEKLYVDKNGTMFGGGGVSSFLLGPTQVAFTGPALNAYVTGTALLGSVAGGSATDVSTRVGTGRTDASTDPSATLLDIATNVLSAPVSKAKFVGSGRLDQKGNDRASTIGNDTQNNPSGINTIASGATSVTILNSLVPDPATKKIRLNLTWRGDPGSRWWWTQTTGAITINLSSPAPANVSCDWELAGLL